MTLLNNSKMPIMKVEWLLNSPCQLSCEYCATSNRAIKEVSLEEKFRILDKVKEFNMFPVIYGGEVTLSRDFESVLGYLRDLDIHYAVISNGIVHLQRLNKWVNDLGLRNWSVSVDTLDFANPNNPNSADVILKSRAGFATLNFTNGIVKDRVANITVTKHNVKELGTMVEKLHDIGVWSLFNLLNTHKPGFVFSHPGATKDLLPSREDLEEAVSILKVMRDTGYKIHETDATFDMWLDFGIDQDWHCSRLSKFVIDCDGTLNCCVDWKGKEYGKLRFADLTPLSLPHFEQHFLQDIWDCQGCAWSSTKDAEEFQALGEKGLKMLRHE